ncbi:MAG TPA: hypothetical protein VNW99_13390 [Cytophagaceae bacterium]|jgi:hypothetical protein|nr:hypothetical protein [Cytophagaceae bacterium]
MKITYENIMEKVVNNQTISRKQKQNALREFLKEATSKNKPTSPDEIAILENLKAVKKSYSQMDSNDKIKQNISQSI